MPWQAKAWELFLKTTPWPKCRQCDKVFKPRGQSDMDQWRRLYWHEVHAHPPIQKPLPEITRL